MTKIFQRMSLLGVFLIAGCDSNPGGPSVPKAASPDATASGEAGGAASAKPKSKKKSTENVITDLDK